MSATEAFKALSISHDECIIVCLDKIDGEVSAKVKCLVDLERNSTLKHVLPKIIADIVRKTNGSNAISNK